MLDKTTPYRFFYKVLNVDLVCGIDLLLLCGFHCDPTHFTPFGHYVDTLIPWNSFSRQASITDMASWLGFLAVCCPKCTSLNLVTFHSSITSVCSVQLLVCTIKMLPSSKLFRKTASFTEFFRISPFLQVQQPFLCKKVNIPPQLNFTAIITNIVTKIHGFVRT